MALFMGSGRVVPVTMTHFVNNQSKSGFIPSTESIVVTPDYGYTGLGQVTVEAIPSAYVMPSGTYTVTNSGTYDIKSKLNVSTPAMASPTWTNSFDNANAKLTYSVNIKSGFNNVAQSFSSSYTLPTATGTIITPGDTSQVAVESYKWTTGSVIVDAIPSTFTIYKKIYEKNPTDAEANFYLNTISSILQYTFAFCSTIQNISASTITRTGVNVFESCSQLISVNFVNLTYLESRTFLNCSKLVSINIPNVSFIGASVFANCTSLQTISLSSVTYLPNYTFSRCSNLTSVYLPLVSRFSGEYNFGYCYNLTTISVPELTYIYGSDFQYCSALETISFPKLSMFGAYSSCFIGCKNLKSIYLMNSSMVYFSRYSSQNWKIFDSSPVTHSSYLGGVYASIYVPSSLLTIYQTDSGWASIADRFVGI